MTLVLQVIALNDEPMSQPLIGRFDERGGTLGRSDTATFTLPDPERMISRFQAQILYRDDGYWIENVSAATSILHNGRAVSSGMRVALRETDELRIGGYTLLAAFENDAASATILRGRTVIIQPKASSTSPRGALAASDVPAVTPSAAPTPVSAHAPLPAPVSMPGATPTPTPTPTPAPVPGTAPTAVTPMPMAAPMPETPPPRGPDIASTLAEPIPTPEFAASLAQQPVGPDADALWRGFLQGSGLDLPLPNGLTPEMMASIGAILRIAIDGIQQMVTLRASAKDEMRAEMTMIQQMGNNPLKAAPNGAVALQLLLQPPARGFLPAKAALREAVIDLQSHQMGVTAGMHSAVEAVLDRFDPAKVESQLTRRSMLDSIMPAHHRAKLWELYLEHYRALRDEAKEDYQRLFGEAFREAYEAKVRSLDGAFESPEPRNPRAGGGTR